MGRKSNVKKSTSHLSLTKGPRCGHKIAILPAALATLSLTMAFVDNLRMLFALLFLCLALPSTLGVAALLHCSFLFYTMENDPIFFLTTRAVLLEPRPRVRSHCVVCGAV